MSRVKDVKPRLESALQAIEDLDGQLAAGRLPADEHARRRAEQEREAGRQLAGLRKARGQGTRRASIDTLATPGGRSTRVGSPLAIVGAGALLVLLGVGGGMTAGRWLQPGRRVDPPAPAASALSPVALQALRPVAVPESAPVPGQLEAAHGALDEGRLDEARAIYTRVLARDPRNVEAITHLGAVLYQEHRVDEAVAKVDEALRIDPRYIHAHWDRAQYLFYGKRDFPAAVRAAEAFLQMVPGGPDADSMRALLTQAREHMSGDRATPR